MDHMTIKGTVSRLVPGTNGDKDRVFFRPEDPGVLRELDGSKCCASGEIPVKVDSLEGRKVGDEVEFDVQ